MTSAMHCSQPDHHYIMETQHKLVMRDDHRGFGSSTLSPTALLDTGMVARCGSLSIWWKRGLDRWNLGVLKSWGKSGEMTSQYLGEPCLGQMNHE